MSTPKSPYIRTTLEEYHRDPPTYAEHRGRVPLCRGLLADAFARVEQWDLPVDYLIVNPFDVVVSASVHTPLGVLRIDEPEYYLDQLKLQALPPTAVGGMWGALVLKSDLVPLGHVVLTPKEVYPGRPPRDWMSEDPEVAHAFTGQRESPRVFDPHVQLAEMVASYPPVPLDVLLRELLPGSGDWWVLGAYGITCQISPDLEVALEAERAELRRQRLQGRRGNSCTPPPTRVQ